MKKRINNISPVQLGIVLGALYAALSLVFAIPFILIFALVGASVPAMHSVVNASGQTVTLPNPATISMGVAVFMAILAPIAYGVLGFIFGIISAVIYNIIAKITGGVEFTVSDVPQ